MSYRKEQQYSLDYTKDASKELGIDFSIYSLQDLRKLWREFLENGMYGICFSSYEDGQEPGDCITEEQVERRIKILKPYVKSIRSFSCIEGNQYVPKIAKKNGLTTLVGAWLSDDLEKNEEELEALITLAKKGYVDVAAVGNEVLYSNDLTLEQLLTYIRRVKKAVPKITVGYVDAYYKFSDYPELVDVCDVILSNCYPFWEGCPQEYSLQHIRKMYQQAKQAARGKKIIITETGWPSQGGKEGEAIASVENAMQYFINTQLWAQEEDIETYYFSSFDESWKVGDEGDVGAYWGLWNKYENLKF